MKFSDRFQAARSASGLNQSEVARELGLKPQSVRQWETGDTEPRPKRITQIAKVLKVNQVWLATGHGEMLSQFGDISISETSGNYNVRGLIRAQQRVPIISFVQAGEFCEATDPYQPGDADEWLPMDRAVGKRSIALRVQGESMYNPKGTKSFGPGDVIVLDPDVEPENRHFVIARLEDKDEATFKQLIMEDGHKYLKAINPDWPNPIIEMTNDTTICGRVVWHQPKGNGV